MRHNVQRGRAAMRIAQLAAGVAAVMALSAQCAQAAPALATNNVNLRQGPGTNYPVITTIPGGSTVEVSGCQGQWCNVVWQGQTGYAIVSSYSLGRNTGNTFRQTYKRSTVQGVRLRPRPRPSGELGRDRRQEARVEPASVSAAGSGRSQRSAAGQRVGPVSRSTAGRPALARAAAW